MAYLSLANSSSDSASVRLPLRQMKFNASRPLLEKSGSEVGAVDCEWHSVHAWKKLAWLWNEGAPGAPLKLDVVWHCRQSRLTLLSFNMWGFGPPWTMWQDWHPSTLTAACSYTNGPCLSVWHCEADGILRGGGSHLLRPHRAVHVVAIAALDQPLIHAMVEGHIEFGLLLRDGTCSKARAGLSRAKIPSLARGAANGRKCNSRRSWRVSELIAFMCCGPPAWHVRQRSLISLAE